MKFKEKIKEHVKDLYAPKDEKTLDELMERHFERNKVFKIKVWPQNPNKLKKYEQQATDQVEELDEIQLINKEYGFNYEFDDIGESRLALESIGQAQTTSTISIIQAAQELTRLSAISNATSQRLKAITPRIKWFS